MDGFHLDVFVPEGDGTFPTVLTLHGASGGKAAMEPLASALAEQGWIVFNANWLSPTRPLDADALELSFEAAGCALRFAGAAREDYGGEGGPLKVVGLSAGGLAGALTSLDPSEFGTRCDGAAAVPQVDLFIGLEGAYLNAAEGTGGLASAIRERPDLTVRLDPRSHVAEAAGIRVVLFLGDQFPPAVPGAEIFSEYLNAGGIPAEIRHVTGPHVASTFTEGVLAILGRKRP